ncbi:hypothetical protein [Hathewaya limosa]|uniref:Uncharacterized membrane protein YbaN (DUF454 family) n=1 Tax=Hathewaya limosa TaxID=1536 RepID=A0ABU0JUM1_HATLI|nr:hypothetical protein [Hathewaya limosa]MDQ0479754.1 uncharacterized membrane protein YbaN (DUF454 family) [Hathewaya limosa]
MRLMLISVILGYLGIVLGRSLGSDFYSICFGLIGFFLPVFYILEKIYTDYDR